ncbi:MAG: hypothetical protein MZU97_21155 [Bacillus subtilis]|nr:hypothetical protein [Bacillus subtilis]
MINQLPILHLVALLLMAILIPFLQKISFKLTLWLGGIVIAAIVVSSLFLWGHVAQAGLHLVSVRRLRCVSWHRIQGRFVRRFVYDLHRLFGAGDLHLFRRR